MSPRLFELYRDDQVNLEQMVALAASDDHAAQEQAWDSLDKWSRQPHTLRRLLTAQRIDVKSDRVARYVRIDAFKKAGGTIGRDLFSDGDDGFIDDAVLLETLALAKLGKAAKTLNQEGHAWVDVRVRMDHSDLASYARAHHTSSDHRRRKGGTCLSCLSDRAGRGRNCDAQ